MSLFDPWEIIDAAQEHKDAYYKPGVLPGDVIHLTRRNVVDSDRFDDGRPLCLINTDVLQAMAESPGAHPDSTYLAEERSLETMLVQVDGMVLRELGIDDHVVFIDPSTVTLDHDVLEPERVVVMEVDTDA